MCENGGPSECDILATSLSPSVHGRYGPEKASPRNAEQAHSRKFYSLLGVSAVHHLSSGTGARVNFLCCRLVLVPCSIHVHILKKFCREALLNARVL